MEFMQSETILNLAKSFAGESQARNRYTIYAGIARKEGHELIARLFEETAHNELEHAEEFFKFINELSDHAPVNLRIDAGYPYPLGDTAANLGFAAEGEREEHAELYPAFAEHARKEGFAQVAQKFELIAAIELTHQTRFAQMQQLLTTDKLYRSSEPIIWRCANCGHIHYGSEAWTICPVCQKPQGWAEKMPGWDQSGPKGG